MAWHLHIWRVVHVEPSIAERLLADDSTHASYSGRHLSSKTVTYRCEKCGTEKVERT